MLKKLKLKFILNNMLMAGIAIIAIFFALCVLIFFSEESKLSNVLEENMQVVHQSLPEMPSTPKEPNGMVYDHSFTLLVDGSGNITNRTPNELSEEDLEYAKLLALQNELERGTIFPLGLSYLKTHTSSGTLISFVSREHLDERMEEAIWQCVIAGLISLLIFLFISNIVANLAITPVEEAWKQQKQFLADASHDLKTPLTVILANNNILATHKDDTVGSQMKWIDSTMEEAGRMTELVNKMLELAKEEAAKEELKLGEVDLSEIVENSILQFEVVAFEKNLTIESGIQPNIIVRNHAPTFSKVLEILFDNAIKYSEEGGKISVALYKSSKKIYFSINNKGEYIKPDELPHIFERFYRTNKERNIHGHGLGLSIAKKKCDMMGVKLSVESNEIDGTTFTITLKSKNNH